MAHSSRVYEGGKTAPEKYFDGTLLNKIGMVEIGGYNAKTPTTTRISCSVYFGPDCPQNLTETFIESERRYTKKEYTRVAEIYAAIIALQIILTSLIVDGELTKDIKIILLEIQSPHLMVMMVREHRSKEGYIFSWLKRDMKTQMGEPVIYGEYLKILHEFWLAVEERGVEVQMLHPERKRHFMNTAMELAYDASRVGNSSCFKFPLSASDVLGFFNIPSSQRSFKGGISEEEGADDEGTSDEEMEEADSDDTDREGTEEEGMDEE